MKKTLWRWFAKAVGLTVLAIVLYQAWIFAHVWWWVDHNPSASAFMEEGLKQLQAKNPDAELKQQWMAYSRISVNLKRALVAAEDAKFLDHDGFDWESIQKAYEKDLKKGRLVAGGSTISQQLAKNLFLSKSKTPWRKGEEALITVMLEHMMTKRRIFEIYMNVIEWGNGIYGAEAAARHYFHTSAAALGPEQAARLAAMVPNPRFYDTHRNSRALERRTRIILARMNAAQVPR